MLKHKESHNTNHNTNHNAITENYTIEPFDGIRKSNARNIFGILLIIIIIDFGLDVM